MESGYSRVNDEEIHPQLLDLIPKERNWFTTKRDDDDHLDLDIEGRSRSRSRSRSHGNGDENKLELRLAPPSVEDWSPKTYKTPSKASVIRVSNTSQKRSAPPPVVGWPPIRSFRKNIASSSSKPAPPSDSQNVVVSDNVVKREKTMESCQNQKGFFVKINMNGVPIGRKVDLNAYDSYDKLSNAVDELFRGLLAAQKDISDNQERDMAITGLLDGSGEYTLVYEDNEGDRMLVGDVPWHMFVSTVKRLRVIKSSEISNICLGSKQGKIQL